MRWCYKTVHYELKKEGLLGGAFLDESEVEVSLNEYGMAGWELVSILELQDGLIAVFKQPIIGSRQTTCLEEEEETQYISLRSQHDDFTAEPQLNRSLDTARGDDSPVVPIEEYEIVVEGQAEDEEEPPGAQDDIGSIRIE